MEPGVVNKLKIDDKTSTTVTLSWVSPDNTGGSKILGYIVEYQVKPTLSFKSNFKKNAILGRRNEKLDRISHSD